ncbi:multisubunit sodium/proton antiporter, MrpF subunit [Desulfocicer vacuolatum DSM 3385]|uniref:Multisubunit sodium/proton antiporter, MrpF subunit n=1 Tax=Desulfocicer vacuolatum DSM 3385 TaxID=1121400 RepID=A0A1W1Z0K3_9BACT|nr:monovalent cation/H+ antiporter complex subunit F [Desulfocicer vacuolatum]SMC41985.1 multisubunit sodium/proton antiporter, MrpF subunit [Desulfocicer vacuolatum DSM 3385]
MDNFILFSAMVLTILMVVPLYRAVMGPTILDRFMGVNAIGSKTTVLLIMIGFIFNRVDMFIDIALAYALLNFIAVIASSRYFHKRKGLGEEMK